VIGVSGLDQLVEETEARLVATERKLERTAKRWLDLMQALRSFRHLRERNPEFAVPGLDQTYYGGA